MKKTISLVTACKDRNECLYAVLPSWLQSTHINEIIIVDWTSKDNLKHLCNLDKRIKIIRVDNEQYYIPSQANNLAASFASGDLLLRVDTDYFLNPYYNFFENYNIDETCFVSGEPEICSDRENNPYYKYLFGLLFITKANFNKINGYNENIGYYYSHEDKNIFERLCLLGLKQIKLKNNFNIIHIPHSDKKRFEHFEGGKNITKDEYTIVEAHIGKNLQNFPAPEHFYTSPKVSWDIQKIDTQYFKAVKKNNKLQDFPIVNCISLQESQDRRNILKKQFKQYNINYVNFLLSERFANSNDKIKGKYVHTLNEGTIGCCVSHLKSIKKWLESSNDKYGFFCEDDLSLDTVHYWNNSWFEFINSLPEDWDCVQLLTVRKDNLSKSLRSRLWDDWGVTAYILKREFAKKIINTYYSNNTFILQLPEPNIGIQPLIENLIYTIGKTYTLPLFIENIQIPSTFINADNDVNEITQHKNNHIIAANNVLEMWKDNKKTHKCNNVKIIDCFPFFNEKELLELRVHLLNEYVDEFVILDGNYTHSGQPKEFTCKKIIQELQIPKEKITVIEVDLSEQGRGPATEYDTFYTPDIKFGSQERVQRDYIQKILSKYDDDTVFIISDCDEIIDPKNISFIAKIVRNSPNVICKIPLVYLQGQADFRVFSKNENQPVLWDKSMFFALKNHLAINSPTQIRANFKIDLPISYITQDGKRVEDLGWHFSWMGNTQRIKTKALSYCHHGMVLDDIIYKNCFGQDLINYIDNYKLKENGLPVSGHKEYILKKYPTNKLPSKIFTLPTVKQFLLPDSTTNRSDTLTSFALNIEDGESNFRMGLYYYEQGHTAPALSYFLRCAERTINNNNNNILAYEALIYGYLCYREQKIRDETAKSLIMHAICLLPERPEARWLLSMFFEQKSEWMYSYYHANRGLEKHEQNFESLKYFKDYPGKTGLLFQKAISGYWWGKNDECKSILLDLWNNHNLNDVYKTSVKNNLDKLGIKI